MKKVFLISLGCAKNLVDSENILGLLDKSHYKIVKRPSFSDIIIINTCGFISDSKKESIETIFKMLKYHKKLVVTGCLIQRYYEEIKKEIPEIDLLIPIRDYYRFNALLKNLDHNLDNDEGVKSDYRKISTGNFSAYLKIGEGCSNHCSYCAIPLIRGEYVSRPFNEIILEAKNLALKGYKEIIVLEQDTTKYGLDFIDEKRNIVDLLKELLKIKEFAFIRLLYLYPDEISDELINLIAKEKRLTPYFDIPIQHSETHILKDMNRRGDRDFLLSLFKKIKKRIPNAILRTTIMIGFPGETREDIIHLKEFMKEVSFDHLGAFMYSKEEGTPSYNFPKQVKENVKKKRLEEIMLLQQHISYQNNQKHIGEIMEGIVIGTENKHYLLRSYFNAPDDIDGKIYFDSLCPLKIGSIIKIKITEAYIYDLYGTIYF